VLAGLCVAARGQGDDSSLTIVCGAYFWSDRSRPHLMHLGGPSSSLGVCWWGALLSWVLPSATMASCQLQPAWRPSHTLRSPSLTAPWLPSQPSQDGELHTLSSSSHWSVFKPLRSTMLPPGIETHTLPHTKCRRDSLPQKAYMHACLAAAVYKFLCPLCLHLQAVGPATHELRLKVSSNPFEDYRIQLTGEQAWFRQFYSTHCSSCGSLGCRVQCQST
jgi:hypothetical protein